MRYYIQGKINKETAKGTFFHVLVPDEQIARQIEKYIDANGMFTGELRIDDGRTIDAEQRKYAHATIKDIAKFTGDVPEALKEYMKYEYIIETDDDYFSLSSCSVTTARLFINFLLDFAIKHGIPLEQAIVERTKDIDAALYSALMHKRCIVCGRDGEVHHWDAIGMGQDRTTYDDSEHKKICLCRKHHGEAHNMGRDAFSKTYHVYGIKFKENEK